jgi:hypothetical protein
MPIDLDDPIALMLVAASALERVGLEAAAYGGLTLGMSDVPYRACANPNCCG